MVILKPASSEESAQFYEIFVSAYSNDAVAGRLYRGGEEAIAHARNSIAKYSSQEAVPNVMLAISVEGVEGPVGFIWYAVAPRDGGSSTFVLQLFIKPAYRRRGYAKEALLALEGLAISLGHLSIGLSVFHHNSGARELYASVGFQCYRDDGLSMMMDKPIACQDTQQYRGTWS